MNVIWKYTVQGPRVTVEMPEGAQILSLQVQDNQPQIWALVDPSKPTVKRYFCAYPTGAAFDATALTYIGTFLINGGTLVFHIFEQGPP